MKRLNICQLAFAHPDMDVRVVSSTGWQDAAILALDTLGYPGTEVPDFDRMQDPQGACEQWIDRRFRPTTAMTTEDGLMKDIDTAIMRVRGMCGTPTLVGADAATNVRFWTSLVEAVCLVAAPESPRPGGDLPPGYLLRAEYAHEPAFSQRVDEELLAHHLTFLIPDRHEPDLDLGRPDDPDRGITL